MGYTFDIETLRRQMQSQRQMELATGIYEYARPTLEVEAPKPAVKITAVVSAERSPVRWGL